MKDWLVSVIVPCYNVENYIGRCLDSIFAQTHKNIEVIVVDDGSTDRSGEIVDDYSSKHSRLKVLHSSNKGPGIARNVALDFATGDFITFVDSDDVISMDYIESLLLLIEKYNADIAITNYIPFSDALPQIKEKKYEEKCLDSIEAIRLMFLQNKFDTSSWAKIYKSSLFNNKIRFPEAFITEDLATIYKLMIKSKKIVYTMEPYYYYFVGNNSLMRCSFNKKQLSVINIVNDINKDITNNIPQLIPEMRCRMLSALFNVFMKVDKENHEDVSILWNEIKKYRKDVMFYNKARLKAKLGAFISYFGKSAVRFTFSLI